ncbi:G-protein coupled receptor Mth2-like [Mercenaria mercenaria]|uniref:G-protein coupled receptor Mth2-like n=1 Tax=Mercenaria mercenaria TaxID=6596 RepID=UPI00234EB0EA|nr:G-protein coupled receptor Mth2-like [Mercenaria mercenaria]
MYFGYILYVCSSVLMLINVECVAAKENKMIRPKVSSSYCIEKFSCGGNHTNSCYCDSLCETMGDCCKGFKTNKTLVNIPAKTQYSCYKIPKVSVRNAFGALVVSACPENWNDDESRTLCEHGKERVEINNTYVSSGGIIFKNLFCAFCSGVLPSVYSFRTLQVCTNDSLDEELKKVERCNDLYNKNAQIDSIRTCPLNVKKVCTISTTDDLSKNCTDGYYGLVYDSFGNMYKNIYCGLCNNISENDLSCEKDKVNAGDPYVFTILINSTNTSSNGDTQMYATVTALVISIVSLVITLVVYGLFPALMNLPGKITFFLALTLLLAQLLFLISSETEQIPWLCIAVAVLVHFFFTAAFCWMNVIAFDLWMTFSNRKFDCGDKMKFCYYNVYTWSVPAIIVSIGVILNFSEKTGSLNPQYGKKECWIFSENAKLLLFIGPLALFKLFDVVAFSCTVYYIRKAKREASFATEGKGNVCLFFINLKLSLIMGLTWTFAFLAKYTNNDILWYMFIIFNALQGFFICVCFVCTKQVFNQVRKSFTNNLHVQSNDTKSSSV